MTIKKKYQSIPNTYSDSRVFYLDEVVVTEKVDGTNFSFGIYQDSWMMNSRNNMMWKKQHGRESHVPQFDGFGAVDRFKEIYMLDSLFENLEKIGKIMLFGEFYGPKIQKRINYSNNKDFVFFDAFDMKSEDWIPWDEFVDICQQLGVAYVPVLHLGPPDSKLFDKLALAKSVVASLNGFPDQISEGIVIKGTTNQKDKHGERIIAKYKSDAFNEVKLSFGEKSKVNKKREDQDKVIYATDLAKKYITMPRLDNCLEKMRGENKPMSMKIIPDIISYMSDDSLKDMFEDDKSNNMFDEKAFRKAASRETVDLYKSWLNLYRDE